MKRLLITLILLALLTLTATAASLPDAKFRHLDTRDGLSSSQVNCVMRDSRGFVWIGTSYGLNRYDGYRVKSYYANMRDTTTLRDNYVSQIFEAYDGKLWIQQGMTYCIYDPATERFDRNVAAELSQYGINGGIERLYIDGRKNFWVKVYEDGIYYYNPHSRRLHHFTQGYGPQEIDPRYAASWFAERGSSVLFTTTSGDIVCLDGERGRISWRNSWMRRHGGQPNQDYRLRIDSHGNLMVMTVGHTYFYIQKLKRWFDTLDALLRAQGFEDVPTGLNIWDVLADSRGRLWVATDHEGLFVIDPHSRQMRQYVHEKYDPTTISDNTPRNLYEDANGQIWIGTYKNGANQFRDSAPYARSIELGDVNAVTEDRYGNYWIGTNDQGIIVYNPFTGEQLQHYTVSNSQLTNNIIVGATTASDGTVWFGSYNGGLIRCRPTAGASGQADIHVYHSTGQRGDLANNSVWSVTEDRWHRIWVGLLGGGIQMLDPRTGQFRTWDTSNTALPSNYITSATWTRKGWLMVGTSYFYALLNPVKGRLVNQLLPGAEDMSATTSNTVCVTEDSRGLIWQGSAAGVCVYDPARRQLETLDMTNGLYGSSVCSITEDQSHVMWVVTEHGVSRIIPHEETDGRWHFILRSFNHRDGLQQGTYNQRSAYLTRDGHLLIGGQDGLDVIIPQYISTDNSRECPLFCGLTVFDQEVSPGTPFEGRVIIDRSISQIDRLDLRYSENNFTIQLGSDAGLIANGKRFAYKLEGFRDTWNKTAENNPNISFMSLRYGNYTLRVRMSNDDGTLGRQERVMHIHVAAPFWRTRWALLFYVLAVIAAAWWWRRFFLRHQAERMEIERMRRETEKAQWMYRMQQEMHREATPPATPADHETAPADAEAAVVVAADLVSFVRRTVSGYKLPTDKRIRLQFLPLVENVSVQFDAESMERILHILLDNAVNFSPSDTRIKVMVDHFGDQAEVRVADNGLGIPEEAKPYIFTPPIGEDNNIGLHTVKELVERQGGKVRAEDNAPTGTVFFITLPLAPSL